MKKIINWINWHLAGLRDPECFFEVTGDDVDSHIATVGIDEPTINY